MLLLGLRVAATSVSAGLAVCTSGKDDLPDHAAPAGVFGDRSSQVRYLDSVYMLV